jgi:predicted dehydrogenase
VNRLPAILSKIPQRWPMPSRPRPIIFLGCGGIVESAHLPAYRAAGLPVRGVYDIRPRQSRKVAKRFSIPAVFSSLEEAIRADRDTVFDIALPPAELYDTLDALPRESTVLIQKPLGLDLDQATELLNLCRDRSHTAAVNFQLRFAPNMLIIRAMAKRGLFGRLIDAEIHVNTHTPWHKWPFLYELPHMEITMHSIHYLDLLRSLLGAAREVFARTFCDPRTPQLHSARSNIIVVFSEDIRGCITTNHGHAFGRRFQDSYFRIEGERGAAVATMGANVNYPSGRPDTLWVTWKDNPWRKVPLAGNWFPHAFAGPMCNLQRYAAREDKVLLTDVGDAWKTMDLVEACRLADGEGGIVIEEDQNDMPGASE